MGAQGQVTIANGGDLLKEAGLITGPAVEPVAPPVLSHDWRAPGYVAAVGGTLYDPRCVPLASVGINSPNLIFRGIDNTLEFMRDRRLRWLRVFATGHGAAVGPNGPPQNVETSLRRCARCWRASSSSTARTNPSSRSMCW